MVLISKEQKNAAKKNMRGDNHQLWVKKQTLTQCNILFTGIFAEKNINFIIFFSLIFSIFEFLRGNLLTGFPWNLISYTWSWSNESIQILSLIGTYSLSLISITFFCIPFLFFQKNIKKNNIIFLIFFLIIFVANYSYGIFKLYNNNYRFDKNNYVKIISPNFSLKTTIVKAKNIKFSN